MSKILLLGHARHGKGTVSKMLGLNAMSSSRFALETFLYDKLNNHRVYSGLRPYTSHDEAYSDRKAWRHFWFDAIEDYNEDDWSRLARELIKKYDCYDGMRSRKEYEASKHLFDRIYWIDASDRKPLEPATSMQIKRDERMIVIDNNGYIDDLKRNLDEFF